MSDRYYVYTLARPDGSVFYVGKGQDERAFVHERGALYGAYDRNREKQAIISAIIAAGESMQTTIIARFASEEDALMYEWALIHLATYADALTNKRPCLVRGGRSFVLATPETKICLVDKAGRRTYWELWDMPRQDRYYHDVRDLDAFCRAHRINRRMMQCMLDGRADAYGGWHVLRSCECGASA